MRNRLVTALLFVAPVSPLAAQVPDWVTQLLAAAELPVVAVQIRNDGVAASQVQAAIDAMAASRLRAHEARQLLVEERDAIRDHGPVDNFGAFVQTKLAAGLRGRDLATAIKAEHAARGKGKPQGTKSSNDGRGGPGGNAARSRAGADARARQDSVQRAKGAPRGRPDRPSR
jgi:hypothetical protein